MMSQEDFEHIVREAWISYDPTRAIVYIEDISAKVSTNHVFRLTFEDGGFYIAKLSYFGRFENFCEDHQIIQVLSNNLPMPYERFLARSLMKGNKLFVYRHKTPEIDAWVVFYLPLRIKDKMPKILGEQDIKNLAKEFARFHKSCTLIRHTLPSYSKSVTDDLKEMLEKLHEGEILQDFADVRKRLVYHCEEFLKSYHALDGHNLDIIPVFVDWNIGNFSMDGTKFYSRWDYDWFRMGSRVMDFYFISRVVSDVGDRSVFTYNLAPLNGERFHYFLKVYHKEFPLSRNEIFMIKEAYRFFLLHYVMHFGSYFFSTQFAEKLQKEVAYQHFDSVDDFDPEALCKILNL